MARAAERPGACRLLTKLKACARSPLFDVANSRIENALQVGRHVTGEVGFGKGRRKTPRRLDTFARQFRRKLGKGAGRRSDVARSTEGSFLIRREARDARQVVTGIGLGSKALRPSKQVAAGGFHIRGDGGRGP